MSVNILEPMIGATMSSVETPDVETMVFTAKDGRRFVFWYEQDCCASCTIEDVAGDLDDLVGSPLVMAEEVSNEPEPEFPGDYTPDSYTWTFYKFATAKGSVTVRWFGESNGCYSESVSFRVEDAPRCEEHDDCVAHPDLGLACAADPGRASPQGEEPK